MPKPKKTTGKKNRQAPARKVSFVYLLIALFAATAAAAIVIFKNRRRNRYRPPRIT